MSLFSTSRSCLTVAIATCGVAFVSTPVFGAAQFASGIKAYNSGSYTGPYRTAKNAVGSPDDLTGESFGFANILSPFSPAYETNELVGIGKGGTLTVKFATPVKVNKLREIGVFTNVGLVDDNFPGGQNANPASTFGNLRAANVWVSNNGTTWINLGKKTFDAPTNYFSNASSPYLSAPPAGATVANFGKPFNGSLSSFNGENWSQTLTTLNKSAGGEWIDIPLSTGLSEVNFVRFTIPTAGFSDSDGLLFIDAISVNNGSRTTTSGLRSASFGTLSGLDTAPLSTSAAVPEPTGTAVVLVAAAGLLARRRRSAAPSCPIGARSCPTGARCCPTEA